MILIKHFANATLGRHPDSNGLINKIGNIVGSLNIGDVNHGNIEHAVFFAQRDSKDALGGLSRNTRKDILIDGDVFEFNIGDTNDSGRSACYHVIADDFAILEFGKSGFALSFGLLADSSD